MRFIWLALAILTPLITVNFVVHQRNETVQFTYLLVSAAFEILCICFTVSEFIKKRKAENYEDQRRIKHDHDQDIIKWRREFMDDTLRVNDIQKEFTERAKQHFEQQYSFTQQQKPSQQATVS